MKNPPTIEKYKQIGCVVSEGTSATQPPVSFCAGNYTIEYRSGVMSKTQVANPIADGWYTRVRVQDGCIVEASQAPPAAALLPEICAQRADADCAGIEAAPDACNLSQVIDGSQVLTNAHLVSNDTKVLQITGCGTAADPFRLTFDFEYLRDVLMGEQRALEERCGWKIQDGIVRTMPAKLITSVVNKSPNLLDVSINDNCELVFEVFGSGAAGSTPATFSQRVQCPAPGGSMLFSVYQTASGTFIVRESDPQQEGANNPPSGFTPPYAPFYDTLAQAQAYIASVSLICDTSNPA